MPTRDPKTASLRILVVATHIQVPGTHGGSTHVGELVRNLRSHGRTHLIARKGSTGEDVSGIAWWRGSPPTGLAHALAVAYAPAAIRAARAFRPDVIYERGSSYSLGAMISKALAIPMLTMVLDERYSPLSLRHASRVIATRKDIVPARYRHKAVTVSWGANADHFHPRHDQAAARARLGLPAVGEAPVVGYTGSFQDWHGLDVLVDAMARIARGGRRAHLLLIGDGKRRQDAERWVADAGLRDRVVFTGALDYDDVPGALAAADICAAPFTPESHRLYKKHGYALDPLKVFEYLALGRPTVTIRAANVEALFTHDEHLWLVPSGDARALADQLSDLMDRLEREPEAVAATVTAGRARVLAKHTWAAHASHLAALFGEMRAESGR